MSNKNTRTLLTAFVPTEEGTEQVTYYFTERGTMMLVREGKRPAQASDTMKQAITIASLQDAPAPAAPAAPVIPAPVITAPAAPAPAPAAPAPAAPAPAPAAPAPAAPAPAPAAPAPAPAAPAPAPAAPAVCSLNRPYVAPAAPLALPLPSPWGDTTAEQVAHAKDLHHDAMVERFRTVYREGGRYDSRRGVDRLPLTHSFNEYVYAAAYDAYMSLDLPFMVSTDSDYTHGAIVIKRPVKGKRSWDYIGEISVPVIKGQVQLDLFAIACGIKPNDIAPETMPWLYKPYNGHGTKQTVKYGEQVYDLQVSAKTGKPYADKLTPAKFVERFVLPHVKSAAYYACLCREQRGAFNDISVAYEMRTRVSSRREVQHVEEEHDRRMRERNDNIQRMQEEKRRTIEQLKQRKAIKELQEQDAAIHAMCVEMGVTADEFARIQALSK